MNRNPHPETEQSPNVSPAESVARQESWGGDLTTDPTNSPAEVTDGEPAAGEEKSSGAGEQVNTVETTAERIKRLPSAVGLTLLGVGIVGVILPGPIGTPFLIAAGLALAPKTFGRLEVTLQRRWPKLHQTGMGFVIRFLDDFEKRYPPDEKR